MIGANIRKLRLRQGMTQKKLADKLFVSAQAVSRWENDEVEPSVGTILELAKIFGVTADEILNPDMAPPQKEAAESQSDSEDEKEIKEEKNEQEEKEGTVRPFLALCEKCNHPIYQSQDIVRREGVIWCSDCHKKHQDYIRESTIKQSKKERIYSFVFGSLAACVMLILTFCLWNEVLTSVGLRVGSILFSLSMFTFVSCCIMDNNFVSLLFLRIASLSIRAPGLIFTFSVEGFAWLIAMKLLFAILGFFLGIAMFFLALFVGAAVSVFVYPYAIYMNVKHPEHTA